MRNSFFFFGFIIIDSQIIPVDIESLPTFNIEIHSNEDKYKGVIKSYTV